MKKEYGIWVVLGIAVLVMYFLISPNESSLFPSCPFYSYTGWLCPGCGSQRAFHEILHGNIVQAWRYNPIFLLGLIYLIAFLGLKFIRSSIVGKMFSTKVLAIFIVILLVFSIFRNWR